MPRPPRPRKKKRPRVAAENPRAAPEAIAQEAASSIHDASASLEDIRSALDASSIVVAEPRAPAAPRGPLPDAEAMAEGARAGAAAAAKLRGGVVEIHVFVHGAPAEGGAPGAAPAPQKAEDKAPRERGGESFLVDAAPCAADGGWCSSLRLAGPRGGLVSAGVPLRNGSAEEGVRVRLRAEGDEGFEVCPVEAVLPPGGAFRAALSFRVPPAAGAGAARGALRVESRALGGGPVHVRLVRLEGFAEGAGPKEEEAEEPREDAEEPREDAVAPPEADLSAPSEQSLATRAVTAVDRLRRKLRSMRAAEGRPRGAAAAAPAAESWSEDSSPAGPAAWSEDPPRAGPAAWSEGSPPPPPPRREPSSNVRRAVREAVGAAEARAAAPKERRRPASAEGAARGVFFRGSILRFGRCEAGALHTAKIELCNSGYEAATVRLEEPRLPFLVVHRKVRLRPRSFVVLPVRYVPTAPGRHAAVLRATWALRGEDGSRGRPVPIDLPLEAEAAEAAPPGAPPRTPRPEAPSPRQLPAPPSAWRTEGKRAKATPSPRYIM